MRGKKISREIRLDQDNDSVSFTNGSGHTSLAFWTLLLFGSPSAAQCQMRFHRWSASSVSSLVYAPWFESFRNSDLMIPSVVGSSMPALLPSFTQFLLWAQFSSSAGPHPSLAAILSSPGILKSVGLTVPEEPQRPVLRAAVL